MQKFLIFFFILISTTALCAVEKLVVIGKGPAGCSAAIFSGQALLSPCVVEGQECDGQLITVNHIENYPGFPDGINGEELIFKMQLQAQRFGAQFKSRYVVEANFLTHPFQVILDNGDVIETHSAIIATGSSPRWLGVPNEEALKGRGVSASATCDGHLFKDRSVVVAGGGDAALEQALLLTEYASQVTLLHRGNQLNASAYLLEKVKSHSKIQILLNAQIEEIMGEEWVKGVIYKNAETKKKRDCLVKASLSPLDGNRTQTFFQTKLKWMPQATLSHNQGRRKQAFPEFLLPVISLQMLTERLSQQPLQGALLHLGAQDQGSDLQHLPKELVEKIYRHFQNE